MKHRYLPTAALLITAVFALASMGFQCSSPNITSGKLYYQQYQSSKSEEKLNKALESFEKEVKEKPNSAEGWYWLGIIQGEKKQYMALQQSWKKAREFGKTTDIDQNSYYFWGQAFNHGANTLKKAQVKKDESLYKEAADAFQAAVLLEPDSSARYNAYVYQAYALMGAGKANEAMKPLETQIKKNASPEVYSLMGELLTAQANELKSSKDTAGIRVAYDTALAVLNEGVVKFPKNAELNTTLLNAYVAAGRVTEAIAKFVEYADNNTQVGSAQYAAGTALLQDKQYEQAAKYLASAVNLDPGNVSAVYNLTLAYLSWGRLQRDMQDENSSEKNTVDYKSTIRKGLPHLDKVLAMQPDEHGNWLLAGQLYTMIDMRNEAESAYARADAILSAKEVKIGMSKSEVVGILGTPLETVTSQSADGTVELLSFKSKEGAKSIRIYLTNGKVTNITSVR